MIAFDSIDKHVNLPDSLNQRHHRLSGKQETLLLNVAQGSGVEDKRAPFPFMYANSVDGYAIVEIERIDRKRLAKASFED